MQSGHFKEKNFKQIEKIANGCTNDLWQQLIENGSYVFETRL